MYLSRLILNPRNRLVQSDLANCQGLHRTILRAFPEKDCVTESNNPDARAQFGVLYRVETDNHTGKVVVLVQSQMLPNWQVLPDGYLLENTTLTNPSCKPIANLYQQLKLGTKLVFRLRANPTRKLTPGKITLEPITDAQKRNGKRVELYKEPDQIDWLKRKATQSGFRLLSLKLASDLDNLQVQPVAKEMGWRKTSDNSTKQLTFGAVLFQGELEITSLELFQQTLVNGIGSGKSYGFGLLSIAANTVS